MCEFLSFSITKDGRILALLGQDRVKAIESDLNPDSHSVIAEWFGVNEDDCWKYEIPISSVDEINADGIDALLEKMKYDGGQPEGDIPLSYIRNIKSFLQQNIKLINAVAMQHFGVPLDFLESAILNGEERTFFLSFPVEVQLKNDVCVLARSIKGKYNIPVIVTPKRVDDYYQGRLWVISIYKHYLPNAIVEGNPDLRAFEYRVQVLPVDDIVE